MSKLSTNQLPTSDNKNYQTQIDFPKKYKHQESEIKWQKFWNENKIYKWDSSLSRKDTFVIDTPPPTVSGVLHMGHIFSYVQADFIARYQRMKGKTVFYPMGFDDNGLPTERLVEKVKKVKAVNLEKSEFVKECHTVIKDAEEQFEELFNSIALSVDWDEKYQTISNRSQKISQLSFIDLFNKGLVTRKMEPVLWDIADRTALSQADLVDQEKPSSMNYISFDIENSEDVIAIATTRPELIAACGAVMVHPEDERYKKLIGQNALTSLFNVKVPIIADENVKIDKGSGAVMCCTFGDETDILWFKNHNLPLRVIIDKSGKIIDNSWVNNRTSYDELIGLNIKQARAKTLEILKDQNLLIKSEEITHFVKCAERSGCPIEIIVTPQWFIKIVDFKKELKEKAEECNWYPAFMKTRIDQWIESISWDWCISRQRFFGVNFPIWYSKRKGEEGKVLIADANQLPCDPSKALPKGYKEEEVEAETDIMDTWATSSISPQLSSGSINDNLNLGDLNRHKKLFPADLRPQAHEIIRSWAFYTIVKALHHENSIPWKNLMISGWCLASDKTKMSKSKGNVVTPNALIKEKGSDIIRYWSSTSNLGSDTAYSEDVLKIGSKLLNKLFNASKFVCTNFQDLSTKPTSATQDIDNGRISQKTDLWILSKAYETIKKASKDFDVFEYAKARDKIEDFFWNDFCDNYLEIAKVRSYGLNAQKYQDQELSDEDQVKIKGEQQSAILTLYYCLNAITKLFAPFLPHICEELYQIIFKEIEGKISVNERGSWPNLDDFYYNESLTDKGNVVLQIISIIRKFKSDNNLSLKTNIKYFDIKTNINITDFIEDLKNVTNSDKINIINSQEADLKITNITT